MEEQLLQTPGQVGLELVAGLLSGEQLLLSSNQLVTVAVLVALLGGEAGEVGLEALLACVRSRLKGDAARLGHSRCPASSREAAERQLEFWQSV